ncbi:2-C-methyl-D-erythritol 4-phosphate cytidylyltransferase [Robinsoniella peoriensis]|uniref:2-C-methyl-D-erythritol 4-phosphate cytidylyltransferase n=1 Tax=Robinsoniella peoriensis TaxID=180332 RepID=A0A4U8Q4J5_9FIRM|nr:2-C-methyl-D-erythritol 4-phosphate cytidylyltransferase [Robinsoniella peoriensis]TLC99153.1 2-C-methyl-D-erythritol 4-phosphate cytidylyltransferase [Robinsoniella peoriensis]
MGQEKNVAVVLCAGRGTRMNSEVQKQYLLIKGKPVVYYSLIAFEKCPFIDEIVLVTGKEEIEYCRHEIIEKYNLKKVKSIVAGGKERYHSVFEGLKAIGCCDYVYIHDGARPFIDQELLQRACDSVRIHKACVVGMPVKDTIKISGQDGFADHTLDRSKLWMVQTPQVFQYSLVYQAYDKIMKYPGIQVTDDAMVVEQMGQAKIKLVEGSYKNIKITTPEDLEIAEIFAKDRA